MPQGWLDIEAAKLTSPAPAPVDNDVLFSQWCIANDEFCEFAEIREDEGEDKSKPDAKAELANITCSRISSRFKLALSYGDLEKANSYRCGSFGSWPTGWITSI